MSATLVLASACVVTLSQDDGSTASSSSSTGSSAPQGQRVYVYSLVDGQHVPSPNFHVIGNDASGALVAEADTDAEGYATLDIPDDGTVSALVLEGADIHRVETVAARKSATPAIHDGTSKVTAREGPPCGQPFDLTVDFTDVPASARYAVGLPGEPSWHFADIVGGALPTQTVQAGCHPRVNVLLFDEDHELVARATTDVIESPSGAPVSLTLPLVPQTSTQTFDYTVVGGGTGDGIFLSFWLRDGGGIWHTTGASSFHFGVPSGFDELFNGDIILTRGRSFYEWSSGPEPGALPPATIDFDGSRLRQVTSVSVDLSNPLNLGVSWTLGEGEDGDAVLVGISAEKYTLAWRARVAPSSSGSIRFPTLPAGSEAWQIDTSFPVGVSHVDNLQTAGTDAWLERELGLFPQETEWASRSSDDP